MEAQQVIDKILSEARSEADAIRSEAQSKAQQMRNEAQSQLETYREETDRLVQEQAQDKIERMKAQGRMQAKKEMLTQKARLLDEIFTEVRSRIHSLDEHAYKELMSNLMIKAVETGDEEVLIGRDENRIDQGLIKQVNRKLVNGFKGNLVLADERADIEAGFLLRRGKVQVNVSTDVLVSMLRDKMESEIAGILFGQTSE